MNVYIAQRGVKFGVFGNDGQIGPWYSTKHEAVLASLFLNRKAAQ